MNDRLKKLHSKIREFGLDENVKFELISNVDHGEYDWSAERLEWDGERLNWSYISGCSCDEPKDFGKVLEPPLDSSEKEFYIELNDENENYICSVYETRIHDYEEKQRVLKELYKKLELASDVIDDKEKELWEKQKNFSTGFTASYVPYTQTMPMSEKQKIQLEIDRLEDNDEV